MAASVVSEPSCGCPPLPPARSPEPCAPAAWCRALGHLGLALRLFSIRGRLLPSLFKTQAVSLLYAPSAPSSRCPLHKFRPRCPDLAPRSAEPPPDGLSLVTQTCAFTGSPATRRQHPLPPARSPCASVRPRPGRPTWTGPSVLAGAPSAPARRAASHRAQGPAACGTRGSRSELPCSPGPARSRGHGVTCPLTPRASPRSSRPAHHPRLVGGAWSGSGGAGLHDLLTRSGSGHPVLLLVYVHPVAAPRDGRPGAAGGGVTAALRLSSGRRAGLAHRGHRWDRRVPPSRPLPGLWGGVNVTSSGHPRPPSRRLSGRPHVPEADTGRPSVPAGQRLHCGLGRQAGLLVRTDASGPLC